MDPISLGLTPITLMVVDGEVEGVADLTISVYNPDPTAPELAHFTLLLRERPGESHASSVRGIPVFLHICTYFPGPCKHQPYSNSPGLWRDLCCPLLPTVNMVLSSLPAVMSFLPFCYVQRTFKSIINLGKGVQGTQIIVNCSFLCT